MKNTIRLSMLLATAAAIAFAQAPVEHAFAQAPVEQKIHVSLPYALHVRDTVLPAGEYSISLRSEATAVLTVSAKDGHAVLFVPTMSRNHYEGNHGELLIGEVNGQHYLEGVCFEGDATAFDISAPHDLKNIASR